MLEPSQFSPNDAWILFRLNDAPVATKQDGDFNVLCLMDAASCYILGNDFVPVLGHADPAKVAGRLVATAQDQTGHVPKQFLVSDEIESSRMSDVAAEIGADLVFCGEEDLDPFVSEAKDGFLEHIGSGRRQ